MDKQKIFWCLITIIIAVIALIITINLVFRTDKINEGKFRLTDFILTSQVDITNKSNINGTWSIDLSQSNKLSMLIVAAQNVEIVDVSLKNINTNKENIIISELNNENKLVLDDLNKTLKLEYALDENNQMLLELVVINENILKNWAIPDGINEIIYDGRIFNTAKMTLQDIQFKIRFDLVITESTGKTNTMKVELKLPKEQLLTNGADVRRLDAHDFKFKIN